MSSPITLYIVPNTGIEIELEGEHVKRFAKKSVLPANISTRNSSPRARKSVSYYTIHAYQLRNYLKEGVSLEKIYSGAYSPLSDVTLPSAIRKIAGIPSEACYYTYIHPPNDLARDIDKARVKDVPMMKLKMEEKNDFASPFIATLGGYVYLDKDLKIVSVNALSLHRTKYDLKLSGPFPTDPFFSQEIVKCHRAKPFVLDCFFEVGYVASAWIRPKEKFQNKLATDKHDYSNGCFLFFKDDGSSCVYSIDASGYIDPNGDTSPLADAFRVESQVSANVKKKSSYVLNHVLLSEEEKLKDRKLIKRIQNVWDLNQYIDHHIYGERRGLLHTAVKIGCTKDDIAKILNIAPREEENLLHKDEVVGFTPLHCACRHQPKNTELIQYLIDKKPKAVTMKDKFDRMPLHIACDVGISHTVIQALIDADVQKKSIITATKLNGRLPIHIACFNKEIEQESIKLLCDADPSNGTLLTPSLDGRLPLHCAVSQKMDVGIIKILLGLNEVQDDATHSNEAIEVVTASAHRARNALYETYLGMLPLHLAVWKNCPVDTIEVLLEADTRQTTVIATVGHQSHLVRDIDLLDEDERESQRKLDIAATTRSYHEEGTLNKDYDDSIADTLESGRSSEIEVQLSSSNDDGKEVNVTALHLAAQNGNGDVILKLLQKETDIREGNNTLKYEDECIKLQDKDGRTPLHLYITNEGMSKHTKPDPNIVSALLEMDYCGETTHIKDNNGFFPLHCAVDRDNADVDIVEYLLMAEEYYFVHLAKTQIFTEDRVKKSTHTCDDRKRSPLYLAVKAGASEQVIELLCAPEHFYLKGFDGNLVTGISSMAVKNTTIQNLIIKKLSERCYFSLLFMDVYANATALSVFLVGSQRFVDGSMTIKAPIVLLSCVGVFILREFIQLKSQSSTYFADAWNWMNISSITALALSSKHMFENQGKAPADFDIDKRLLTVTGALLIAQFTFFLRSTFLPFARFVGGLTLIFSTLIPFFIVSSLLLLAFAYGFYIQDDIDECDNITNCYAWTLNGFFSGSEGTSDLLDVLFGVIAIVVLLNVVIAIVSEAWESAADRALNLFWKFRLEFLTEARFFAHMDRKFCRGGIVEKFGDIVDGIADVKFVDNTPWNKHPYSMVKSKKQYNDPYAYFPEEIAKQIRDAHSLQADLYWTKTDSRRKNRSRGWKKMRYWLSLSKWLGHASIYFFLCLLGLVTAGWMWPQSLRRQVLAIGVRKEHNKNNKKREEAEEKKNT